MIGEPENGVDVCCWDYLARDNRDLNIIGINYIKRFLQCAQVSSVWTSKVEPGGEPLHDSIILRDKVSEQLLISIYIIFQYLGALLQSDHDV